MELKDKHFICFDGTYDYYLEKRDMLLELDKNSSSGKTDRPGSNAGVSPAPAATGSKESWENAKKQQAIQRKLENEFKHTEEEISRLEHRNEELDEQMSLPENATVSSKLMELSKEHEENDRKLEELMEKWEELYEKLNGGLNE